MPCDLEDDAVAVAVAVGQQQEDVKDLERHQSYPDAS
jgi:hypothetical protein